MKRNHVQFFQQELFTRSFTEEMTALAPIKDFISFRWLLEAFPIVWRHFYQQLMWHSELPKTPLASVILQSWVGGLFRSLGQLQKFCFIIKWFSPTHQSAQMSQASWFTAPQLFQSHRNDPWSHESWEKNLHWLPQRRFLLTPSMPVVFNPANKQQLSLTLWEKIASETQFLFSPPWHI